MLDVQRAAIALGVSRSLVYALLKSGKLQGLRVGVRGRGKWVIEESDLARFRESCKSRQAVTENESEFKWL